MFKCMRRTNGKTVYQVDKNDTWKEIVNFLLECFCSIELQIYSFSALYRYISAFKTKMHGIKRTNATN